MIIAPESIVSIFERRKHPRVSVTLTAEVVESEGTVHPLRTGDLSLGGMKCYISRFFPETTLLSVRLEIPMPDGKEWVSMEGVVIRSEALTTKESEKYCVAIHFTYIHEEVRKQLSNYLKDLGVTS